MREGSLLFVYGTLRKGERADLSRNQKEFDVTYLGADVINGLLYNLGSYPGVKELGEGEFDVEQPRVHGDVFRLENKSIIEILDHYEGYPYLYNRAETETMDGRKVWVYTYNGEVDDERRIVSGDWVNRPTIQTTVRERN
jgi:gamma-glutamylcyclotransferase (GGCT)/AIG2-like uncharacterized protein YtfP